MSAAELLEREPDIRSRLGEAIEALQGAQEMFNKLEASQPALRQKYWDAQSKLYDAEEQLAQAKRDQGDISKYLDGEAPDDSQIANLQEAIVQASHELERAKLLEISMQEALQKAEQDIPRKAIAVRQLRGEFIAPHLDELLAELESHIVGIRTIRRLVANFSKAVDLPAHFLATINASPN